MWVGILGVGLRGGLEGPEEGVTEAPDVARLAMNCGGNRLLTSSAVSANQSGRILCATRSPFTCLRPAPIYAPSSCYLVIAI